MKTVAVIGCGKVVEGMEGWAIGHCHAQGYLDCGQEVKLLGVDVSPENLEAFRKRFDLPKSQLFASTDELYASVIPDCVSICTWPSLHHPMVMEALEKGVKGIACEKPFALNVAQIRELEAAVKEADAKLVICHQRRLESSFIELKDLISSGQLGTNLHLFAHVGDGWDILSWTTHWFDMANFLFDGPPSSILAGMDLGDTRRYQHAVEDASIIWADYDERGMATFLTGPKSVGIFSITGSNGIAVVEDGKVRVGTLDGSEPITVEGKVSNFSDGFTELFNELLGSLDGGPDSVCSITQTAVATEMAYAAHESARTGKMVSLPLDVRFAPLDLVQNPARSAVAGKQLLLYADSHFESGGREGIAEAFTDLTGLPIRVVDAEERGLTAEDLEGIDAVCLYHTQRETDEETRDLLESWVAKGRPLFILHAALGAWPDWEAYSGWCGKVWEWGVSVHPYEAAVLTPTDGDPLAFGWQSAWLPVDEVFVKLKDTSEVNVFLETEISIGTFPVAWQNREHPNVGVWMPGHRRDSWKVPAMRDGAGRVLARILA